MPVAKGCSPEASRAPLRNAVIPARVTINAGIPTFVTSRLLKAPIPQPSNTTVAVPSQGFQPSRTTKIPMMTVRNPYTEPTERSNSPAIKRNVMPTPATAISETCRIMFRRLSAVRK